MSTAMVPEGNLADAFSILSDNASASTQSDQDVGPLVLNQSCMLVLFLVLFLGQPVDYFWFELIPLNVLFVYLIVRQEKMAKSLERLLVMQRRSA